MDIFMHIWQDYGLLIILLILYSRMRYGGANIRKYERWDRYRKKVNKKYKR